VKKIVETTNAMIMRLGRHHLLAADEVETGAEQHGTGCIQGGVDDGQI